MDITKCFELLEARSKEQPNFIVKPNENGELIATVNVEHYSVDSIVSLKTEDLLTLFTRLQEERICTYKLFEDELLELIETKSLVAYPSLCATITEKFNSVSLSVRSIRTILATRGFSDLVGLLSAIQEREREKLTFVAARHLDIMHEALGSSLSDITGGKSVQQQEYLRGKISDTERLISELLEEIQCIKCDLHEEEAGGK